MRRYLILLVAGLCLAIIGSSIACSKGNGPIFPDNFGLEISTFSIEEGEITIAQQPFDISWDIEPTIADVIDEFKLTLHYGNRIVEIATLPATARGYSGKMPTELDTSNCHLILTAISNFTPSATTVATTGTYRFSLEPFGDADHLAIAIPEIIRTNEEFSFLVLACDQLGNTVCDYSTDSVLITNIGSVNVRLNNWWTQAGGVQQYVSPLFVFESGVCDSWTPAYVEIPPTPVLPPLILGIKIEDNQNNISGEVVALITTS